MTSHKLYWVAAHIIPDDSGHSHEWWDIDYCGDDPLVCDSRFLWTCNDSASDYVLTGTWHPISGIKPIAVWTPDGQRHRWLRGMHAPHNYELADMLAQAIVDSLCRVTRERYAAAQQRKDGKV